MLENGYLLVHSDCLTALRQLPDNSVDSIVTDPPYGLSFMGKKWDYDVPGVDVWAECLRVLKPGGHLLAFAGTRTQHRMAVRIEDAGFEIRDMIAWVYGSGFPKSLDVSKAIDKAAGAERDVVGTVNRTGSAGGGATVHQEGGEKSGVCHITAPATDAARQWQGWGTALKPALEPITVARKPLVGTVAANVLEHGTGALNIDACRVGASDGENRARPPRTTGGNTGNWKDWSGGESEHHASGRWPANLIHDGSDEVAAQFPTTGPSKAAPRGSVQRYDPADAEAKRPKGGNAVRGIDDNGGSAARFFYCAKASKSDRGAENNHPTVKPTELMRYLVRLVTPPGGVVLDPFMGSGSTGKAAVLDGFRFVGVDMSAEYVEIARARIQYVTGEDLC